MPSIKEKPKNSKKKINTQIIWKSVEALVANVKPTPNNYKIKNDLGKERFLESLKSFGLAGNAVCNWGSKAMKVTDLILIDGNSRLEQARENGLKKVWVSVPSRYLAPKEFQEMSAMFDFAKAGDVDIDRIKGDLGTAVDFFKRYGLEPPMAMLEKMGSQQSLEGLEYPGEKQNGKEAPAGPTGDICMVNLFFTVKQEEEFRNWEEKLAKKFKTDNTTMTVYKALKSIIK
jgi:hypothetical protein